MGFNLFTFTKVLSVHCESRRGLGQLDKFVPGGSWETIIKLGRLLGSTSHPFRGQCSVVSRGLKLLECSMPPIIMLVNGGW